MTTLARMDTGGWELDDAEAIAAEHPDTFHLPSRAQRDAVEADALVKLIFRISTVDEHGHTQVNVERMWVCVIERAAGHWIGELDNQPRCTDDIAPGMRVAFDSRHVIDIWGVDWE
ncbi:DUF2314 domain-containing protein [Burkholderia stabilis]|uniref:DUF2314 domain-containing protein n=1 Tax=Burkholderia stabilis TaxID=95485 RepID=UPI001F4B0EB7|nr:DUF2314 domain-containing protein [Burkholderia stabilis]